MLPLDRVIHSLEKKVLELSLMKTGFLSSKGKTVVVEFRDGGFFVTDNDETVEISSEGYHCER